ncbi:MAG: hypothetical protein V4477_16620 [Pseudomonadota bacterium]
MRLWAGFVDGRIDTRDLDTGFGGFGRYGYRLMPAVFTSKRSAREQYEDVREVEIKEVGKRKKRSRDHQ